MSVNPFAKYCMQGSGSLIINRIVHQPVKIDYNSLHRWLWIVFCKSARQITEFTVSTLQKWTCRIDQCDILCRTDIHTSITTKENSTQVFV